MHLNVKTSNELGSPPLNVFVFRAIQELLFNVVKHAQAKEARVTLGGARNHMFATVRDDGRGFDPESIIHTAEPRETPDRPPLPPTGTDTGLRVLLVGDHQVMRQGLTGLLAGQAGIAVVGEAADGQQAIASARELRPDLIIMDVSMPKMDGIEATRRIKAEMPEIRIIGLSMHEDDQIGILMRKAGAESFLSKSASSAELLKAIAPLPAD